MKTAKLMALLMCIVLLATAVLAACQPTDDTGTSSAGSSTSGTQSGGQGADEYHNSTGRYWPTYSDEKSASLIGERTEIRVLVYNNTIQTTYYSEEIEPDMYNTTDSTLNEAVKERNNYVHEQLGVEIKAVPVDNVGETLQNAITAGEGDFDIAMPFISSCTTQAVNGNYYDLREFEEKGIIDLSAPWYDQNANESFSIKNKMYFTVSDMTIMQMIVSIAMMYNPDILETNYPDVDIFQLVLDKEWTLDKMIELARGVADDSNGDGVLDYNDTWGISAAYGDAVSYYLASGEKLCTKNENDEPIIAIGGDRSLSISQKVLDNLQDKTWVIHAQDLTSQGYSGDIWEGSLEIFGEERALFRNTAFSAIKKIRNYSVDYRVIPLPLMDDTQDEYYTPCNAVMAYGVVIPTFLSEEDANFAAYMMDVMSATGRQYIRESYYEQILKNKDGLSDEDQSIDMLDLVFSNIVYDVGRVYNFGGLNTLHDTLMKNNSTAIASQLESIRSAAEQAIADVIERYS